MQLAPYTSAQCACQWTMRALLPHQKKSDFALEAGSVQLVLSAGHLRVASSANNAAIISNLMKH